MFIIFLYSDHLRILNTKQGKRVMLQSVCLWSVRFIAYLTLWNTQQKTQKCFKCFFFFVLVSISIGYYSNMFLVSGRLIFCKRFPRLWVYFFNKRIFYWSCQITIIINQIKFFLCLGIFIPFIFNYFFVKN